MPSVSESSQGSGGGDGGRAAISSVELFSSFARSVTRSSGRCFSGFPSPSGDEWTSVVALDRCLPSAISFPFSNFSARLDGEEAGTPGFTPCSTQIQVDAEIQKINVRILNKKEDGRECVWDWHRDGEDDK